ncbi:UxaA family hydrolase [Sinobaca sp. H24]|uniref:UxaA family hydrolase n=1 Tax=Sinobaca sp. H24 TaxID=2923376 RepID=UPI002079E2A4|nr:UxaA family hydrolase [Sinobaca sp. H24]
MASAGCGAALVISSRGIFTGSVAMPSIMIAPSSEGGMYDELIDYKISSKNVETQMEDITETIINVCSGQKSSIENLDLGEFSISHSGTPF